MKKPIIVLCLACSLLPGLHAQQKYSLSDCRKMALDNNMKMRNAQLEINAAGEQKKEAYMNYFPTVSASGTYFKSNSDLIHKKFSMSADQQTELAQLLTNMGLDATALTGMPTSYTLSMLNHGGVANIMAMEPIYTGGQITNGNKLAKLNSEVKKLQLNQTKDEIVATTETYYNQLISLYEKEKTLDAADKQLDRIHQDASNAYKAGVSNKNDMLTVELKQNGNSTNRLKLENGIQLCRMLLGQYIGLNTDSFNIDTTLVSNLPNPAIYLIDHHSALSTLNEYQLLDKDVESNHLQTEMKKGKQLPTVAVGVTGVYQNFMGSGRANAIALATISIPISDWWTTKHAIKRQQINEKIAQQTRDDSRQLLVIKMQNAYNNLAQAYEQILLAQVSITKSAENLRLNRDYYHAGTATMSELLDAQTQEQQAQDQLTNAVILYLNNRTAYFQATGREIK